MKKLLNFLKGPSGSSAVEYAILVALITVTIVSAVTLLGRYLKGTFRYIAHILW
jgi:Flp pilus assembly pilin Flp